MSPPLPQPSSLISVTDEYAHGPHGLADLLDWIKRSLATFDEVAVIAADPYLANVVALLVMAVQEGLATMHDLQTKTIEDPPGQSVSCVHAVLVTAGKVVNVKPTEQHHRR
ncbi:hypothetical protein RI367_006122 [Sorochytrium milnesiophthora]